jgi:hypothetical protein
MFKINISNMKRYLLIFMCIAVPFFVYSQNDTLLFPVLRDLQSRRLEHKDL